MAEAKPLSSTEISRYMARPGYCLSQRSPGMDL
jgi:hypothetical protein